MNTLDSVSKLLGYSDVKMTQRYAHLSPQEDAARAAAILYGVGGMNELFNLCVELLRWAAPLVGMT